MAEAELKEIRKLWDEMQYIRTGGVNALFAHIDAQAAEIASLRDLVREAREIFYGAVVTDENLYQRALKWALKAKEI